MYIMIIDHSTIKKVLILKDDYRIRTFSDVSIADHYLRLDEFNSERRRSHLGKRWNRLIYHI